MGAAADSDTTPAEEPAPVRASLPSTGIDSGGGGAEGEHGAEVEGGGGGGGGGAVRIVKVVAAVQIPYRYAAVLHFWDVVSEVTRRDP